jgi:DNA-binding beta-propeller fold protein YncE
MPLMRTVLTAVLVAGCVGSVVSCSSSGNRLAALPAAAEPSVAPALSQLPAGRIVDLPSGSTPEGVAVDPRTGIVVVSLHHPDRVALVRPASGHVVVRRVPGSGRHLVLTRPGGPVLLPAEDTNSLIQVALPSGRVTRRTALPRQPHNVAVVHGRYWVADELASRISVVTSDGRAVGGVTGPVQPGGVVFAGGRVGAVDVRGARMYFYDPRTLAHQGSIALGSGPTHAVPVGDGRAVVADTRGGALLLVDMSTRRVVTRLSTPGGPYGLASDPRTGTVWVTLTASNRILRVDVRDDTLRLVASTSTVQQANTVAFDPATSCLYLVGVTASALEQICSPTDPKLVSLRTH